MINRKNHYKSANKKEILLAKVAGVCFVTGTILGTATIVFVSLPNKLKYPSKDDFETVKVKDEYVSIKGDYSDKIDLTQIQDGVVDISIQFSDLKDVSDIGNLEGVTSINLNDNLITDITPLENISSLNRLNIDNNSVKNINIEKYENLHSLSIYGNYNLYTQDLLDYCNSHDIYIDINQQDVKNVERLREIVNNLDLEGKSDVEKETIIYQYIMDNMEYDLDALEDDRLIAMYNVYALENFLESGKGVCATYATTFDAMCELADINCFTLSGVASDGIGEGAHGWNLVEIDGEYMLCDCTWSDEMPFKDYSNKYYNVTGNKAKKFINEHMESVGLPGDTTFYVTNIKSEKALNSNYNNIKEENSFEKFFSNISSVITDIDFSKMDIKGFIPKLLAGIGAGAVVLLSRRVQKNIKKKVKRMKDRKKVMSKIKQEKKELAKKKLIQEELKKEVNSTPKEVVKPIIEKPVISKDNVKDISELSLDEKIEIINKKAHDKLIQAAKELIIAEQPLSTNKFDIENDELINKAVNELLTLNKYTPIERTKYRIKKNHPDYNNYSQSYKDEARSYTIVKYEYVEKLMSEYNKLIATIEKVHEKQAAM